MAACRLTLLGGFSLEAVDGAKLALPTRKDRLLLAYLAVSAGRAQARDRLAGLLWGDRGEVQARDSLKQSLAGIRQAFRQADLDPLRTDRESVAFNTESIDIDAVEFARLATQPTSRTKAIALYRGDLLDGIDGVSAEFDEWLRSERERLGSLAARVLEEPRRRPLWPRYPTSRSGSAAICWHTTACASRYIERSCACTCARASARRH